MAYAADGRLSIVAEAVSERALRFAREGRHLAAALEYQSLADLDPNDLNAATCWAYHASKGGQRERAAEGCLAAGCIYAARKDVRRALQMAHRAFEIGPARVTRSRIEPIARTVGAAIEHLLEHAADEHAKAGRIQASTDLYALLSELRLRGPRTISGEIRLDEPRDAAQTSVSLREAARQLRAAGRLAEYARVVEAMIAGGDRDPDAVLELGRIYLRRDDMVAAATKLEILRSIAPDRLESAELLLQAYAALGRTREGLEVLHDIVHRRQHEPLLVRALLERAAGLPSRDANWSCAIRSLADWMQNQATPEPERTLLPPPPPAWGTMTPSTGYAALPDELPADTRLTA